MQLISPALLTIAAPIAAAPDPGDLAATAYLDTGAAEITALAARLTQGASDARERAVRVHDFVRDRIAFGWTRHFYDQRASDVLRAGVGYCHTKSTLFVALLRAAGIPARQHFVELRADILRGFVTPPHRYVDHSYSEVWLDGAWRRTDSYIVDPPLFARARAALGAGADAIGRGIHIDGTLEWDGRGDAFAQFVDNGRVADLAGVDYGVFADVGAFYAAGRRNDRLSFPQGLLIRWFIGGATRRVQAFRAAAP